MNKFPRGIAGLMMLAAIAESVNQQQAKDDKPQPAKDDRDESAFARVLNFSWAGLPRQICVMRGMRDAPFDLGGGPMKKIHAVEMRTACMCGGPDCDEMEVSLMVGFINQKERDDYFFGVTALQAFQLLTEHGA